MSWYPLHILCSFNAKNIQKYRLKSFRWVNCSKFTGITPNCGALLRLLNFSRILLQYLIWNLLPKKNLFDLRLISTKYAFWPIPKSAIIEKLIFVIARTLSLFHCKTPQKHPYIHAKHKKIYSNRLKKLWLENIVYWRLIFEIPFSGQFFWQNTTMWETLCELLPTVSSFKLMPSHKKHPKIRIEFILCSNTSYENSGFYFQAYISRDVGKLFKRFNR